MTDALAPVALTACFLGRDPEPHRLRAYSPKTAASSCSSTSPGARGCRSAPAGIEFEALTMPGEMGETLTFIMQSLQELAHALTTDTPFTQSLLARGWVSRSKLRRVGGPSLATGAHILAIAGSQAPAITSPNWRTLFTAWEITGAALMAGGLLALTQRPQARPVLALSAVCTWLASAINTTLVYHKTDPQWAAFVTFGGAVAVLASSSTSRPSRPEIPTLDEVRQQPHLLRHPLQPVTKTSGCIPTALTFPVGAASSVSLWRLPASF